MFSSLRQEWWEMQRGCSREDMRCMFRQVRQMVCILGTSSWPLVGILQTPASCFPLLFPFGKLMLKVSKVSPSAPQGCFSLLPHPHLDSSFSSHGIAQPPSTCFSSTSNTSLTFNLKMFNKHQQRSRQEEGTDTLTPMELTLSMKGDITLSSLDSMLLGSGLNSCQRHWFQKWVILGGEKGNEMQKLPFLDLLRFYYSILYTRCPARKQRYWDEMK